MSFLIYGAYGYTGALVAELAVERGHHPVLAGRDAGKLAPLAGRLGLEQRAFSLDNRPALEAALKEVPFVLHCAGPFSQTAAPMAAACLKTGTHYLDITGEIEVFEGMAARSAAAHAAGVMLLPGVGFDVVPTDCLAAHLKRRLPTATHLELAFKAVGQPSRGTATTAIQNAGRGGAVREGGRIKKVPAAHAQREVDFGRGPKTVTAIPWGDVSTAFHSTGVPDITVYAAFPESVVRFQKASNLLGPVLQTGLAQKLLKGFVDKRPAGPDAEARERGRSLVWGEAWDAASGKRVAARLQGPEGYRLTADAAVRSAERVLGGTAPPGFQTPSLAFGADFVLELDGVTREDL